MDTECAKIKAECDKQIAEMKKQMLLECEQKVQAARKAAAGEYSMENTEADEERIALLLHNGTLVLQMKDLRKEMSKLKETVKTL